MNPSSSRPSTETPFGARGKKTGNYGEAYSRRQNWRKRTRRKAQKAKALRKAATIPRATEAESAEQRGCAWKEEIHVCQSLHSPTQETNSKTARCDHGYYRHARELKTPRCPTCDPMSYALDKDQTSYALALLALQKHALRAKSDKGQFAAEATVAPGMHRCWKCRGVFPLTEEYFWRAKTRKCAKKTGFQGCCKKCQNKRKTGKRQGRPRPGVEALLAVGVQL